MSLPMLGITCGLSRNPGKRHTSLAGWSRCTGPAGEVKLGATRSDPNAVTSTRGRLATTIRQKAEASLRNE